MSVEVVYKEFVVSAFRQGLVATEPFYVQAIGVFCGRTVYFGGYTKGACDYCLDGELRVRCFAPLEHPRGLSLSQQVSALCDRLVEEARGSSTGDINLQAWLRHRVGYFGTLNFIPIWQISLLTEF